MNGMPKMAGIIQNQGVFAVSAQAAADQHRVLLDVLFELGKQGIALEIITYSPTEGGGAVLMFAVRCEKQAATLATLRLHIAGNQFAVLNNLSVISVFGPDFRDKPGVAGPVASALRQAEIQIYAMSTSISTVSCLIETARIQDAEKIIRGIFED